MRTIHRLNRALLVVAMLQVLSGALPAGEPSTPTIDRARQLLNSDRQDEGRGILTRESEKIERLLREDPENHASWFVLGRCRFYLENDRGALEAFEKAINLSPKEHSYHFMKGVTLRFSGKLEEAVESLQKARDLKPDHARYWAELAQVYAKQQKASETLEHGRKAIALGQRDAALYSLIGHALVADGEPLEALEMYRAACELEPHAAGHRCDTGQVLFTLGRMNESLEEFRTAARLAPEDWNIPTSLIQVHEALGMQKERDAQVERLRQMRGSGKYKELSAQQAFCRDVFEVDGKRVMAFESFEINGERPIRYSFVVSPRKGSEILYRVSLGSYKEVIDAAKKAGEIREGEPYFQLDADYPDGSHALFGFFKGSQPAYGNLKELVRAIVRGERQPLSRTEPRETHE